MSLTLPQQNIHFFCLYRPPQSHKNKFTDSLFLDQFPDLLDHCNSLHGSLIILGDFSVHYDCPQNSTTARAMALLFQFNLTQSASQATREKGHILDWLVHRSDDSFVRSTSVTSVIASDHLCVISHLNVTVPRPPPSFVMARNIRAIDRTALRDDLQDCLSGLQSLSAGDLDSHLRCVLDKHAPATRRKVPYRMSAPWFKAVSEKARAAKQQRRRAERQWLKTGLLIQKQIHNRAKKRVTRLVHPAKTSYFCIMIRDSLSSKQLFMITNQLLGNKKHPTCPVFPLIELPQRFLQFCHG